MIFRQVEDPDDPSVSDYTGLRDPDLRIAVEAPGGIGTPHGRFITEGALALARLLESPYPIRSILVSESQATKLAGPLSTVPDGTPVLRASQAVLNRVAGFNLHRGVLASAERLPLASMRTLTLGAARILALEGIVDHENMGGLFRNAAAFGVQAVVLDRTCADPLYRRAVRVSLGHVLRVPFTRVLDWTDALDQLRADGVRVLALTPTGSMHIGEITLGKRPMALLLGSEGPGLTAAALARADERVCIPMADGVDSLNVAAAAAVALYALSD